MSSPLFFNPRTEEEKKEQREQIRRFLNIEKLKVKLNDKHFKALLQKLESKALEKKRKASIVALSNKIPSHVAKTVSKFIARGKRKTKRARKSRRRSRGRRRSRCRRGSRGRRGSR